MTVSTSNMVDSVSQPRYRIFRPTNAEIYHRSFSHIYVPFILELSLRFNVFWALVIIHLENKISKVEYGCLILWIFDLRKKAKPARWPHHSQQTVWLSSSLHFAYLCQLTSNDRKFLGECCEYHRRFDFRKARFLLP